MNLKKTVIISLAALACAGFIAGCGSDKKDAASAVRKQKMKSKSARHRATRNRSWNLSPKKPKKKASK